jgi:hypothetical protein
MRSKVDHPAHYNVGDIETIDYLESLGIAEEFCIGNAIKYLSRYKHKNGIEDLEKAQWYITWVLDNIYTKETFRDINDFGDKDKTVYGLPII